MTSPTIKREKNRQTLQKKKWLYFLFLISRSLLSRRLSAWLLEVCLVTASAVIPYSIGAYVKSNSTTEAVPLNPVLASAEKAKTTIFTGSNPTEEIEQVPPLTNLLWSIALVAPILLTGCQLYLLANTGQTSPKRWLRVKVVTAAGNSPGWEKTILREIIARYGLSGGSAYLLWLLVGAAPDGGILLLLLVACLIIEKGMATKSDRFCALHDTIAGTIVVDAKKGLTTYTKISQKAPQPTTPQPPIVEVQSYPHLPQPKPNQSYLAAEEDRKTNILLLSSEPNEDFNLWQWMRKHPGTTLLSVAGAGIVCVLATVVGTQIYVQTQANQRQVKTENSQVFLSLVNRLSATSVDPLTERKSIILSLARVDDPRTIPLLVDLLGQETNPALVQTIQQALVSIGTKVLPNLKLLNQSLSQDLMALSAEKTDTEQELSQLQLKSTQEVIAKILTLYSGKLDKVDLSEINLGMIDRPNPQFTLSVPQADLSGINFRGAILNHANLQKSQFMNVGRNKQVTDFTNANLQKVNLTEALLGGVILNQTNLTGATLSRANVASAQLNQSNLSGVKMIDANVTKAQLANASLTGANLGNSQFTQANLTGASLGHVKALATNFSNANLTQSNWQGANLTATNFSGANLQQADLSLTQLQEANLAHAQLQNASLVNANLIAADLRGANLDGADFKGVIFAVIVANDPKQFLATPPIAQSMAKIKGVNFTNVRNLNLSQIEFICDRGGIHPQCQ